VRLLYLHCPSHTQTHTQTHTHTNTHKHTHTNTNTNTHTNNERDKLIVHISKEDNWPIRKSEIVKKYLKQIIYFTNSIDYEKL
jgi:hypothetical protein